MQIRHSLQNGGGMKLHNKLVDTDAQGRPVAARPPHLGRGSHAR